MKIEAATPDPQSIEAARHSSPADRVRSVKLIAASTLGNALEFYDFIVYGTISALVFNKLFFPSHSSASGLMLALGTFAAGFLARPLGAAIFGHIGDRLGRKTTLQMTLTVMGMATVGIALLPTYREIGSAAPVVLVLLRILQGIAVGGEWGGAVLLIGEHSDNRRRGYSSSFAQLGSPAGTLLANAVVLVTITSMSEESFLTWGWRLPFALGVVLLAVGWYMRREVDETPVFLKLQRTRTVAKSPVLDVFKSHKKRLLLAVGSTSVIFGGYYLFTTICLAFVSTHHLPSSIGLYGTILGSALALPVLLCSGRLSDRLGRRPMYVIAAVAMGLWSLVVFPLINTASPVLGVASIGLGLAFWAIAYGVQGAFLPELFPAEVRCSAASLAYQVTGAIGGLLPMAAISLMNSFGSTLAVSCMIIVTALFSLISVFFCPETAHD
ncbi:MFS transporter [Paraburkholderia phymatum]|uniref:MFS transporter n=1 Tax=Paraburkholderia phymatum TaxID=148447 RepID=UPI003173C9EB